MEKKSCVSPLDKIINYTQTVLSLKNTLESVHT